jgi:hypothetical protein
MKELGLIEYYVHDGLGVPLVVTDDDVSGRFAFVRALAEHGSQFLAKELAPLIGVRAASRSGQPRRERASHCARFARRPCKRNGVLR